MKLYDELKNAINKHYIWAIAVLVILVLFVYLFLGTFSYVRLGDNIDSFVPRHALVAQHLREFGEVSWVPESGMGIDFRLFESPVYNVSTLFFYFLNYRLAYIASLLFCFFIAGIFSFKLFKERLYASPVVAFIGTGTYLTYMVHEDLLWYVFGWAALPMCIYFLAYFYDKKSKWKFIAAPVLGVLFAVFNFPLLTFIYLLIAVLLWFLLVERKYKVSFLVYILLFVVASVAFHWNDLKIIFELSNYSSRTNACYYCTHFFGYIKQVAYWILLYSPPLILSIFGLFVIKKQQRVSLSLVLLVLFGVIVGMQSYGLVYPLLVVIFGKLADFPLGRFFILLPFFAAAATVITLNHIRPEYRIVGSRASISLKAVVAALFVISMLALSADMGLRRTRLWFNANANFGWTRNQDLIELSQKDEELYRVAVVSDYAGAFMSETITLYGFETIGGTLNSVTKGYQSYWGLIDGTGSEQKHDFTLAFKEEGKLKSGNASEYINFDLLGLANVKYLFSTFALHDDALVLLNDEPAPTIAYKDLSFRDRLKKRWEDVRDGEHVFIYENRYYQPRFFVAENVHYYESKDDLLNKMSTSTVAYLRDNLLLEGEQKDSFEAGVAGEDSEANISVDNYSPDEIRLTVESKAPGFLVVTNTHIPWWKGYVNGEEREVVLAYNVFWAIPIDEGVNDVYFVYKPGM